MMGSVQGVLNQGLHIAKYFIIPVALLLAKDAAFSLSGGSVLVVSNALQVFNHKRAYRDVKRHLS